MCNAVHKDCILSATFTKMVAVASAKWRGKPCVYARAPTAPPRHHTAPHRTVAKAPSPPTCRPFSVISILPGGVHVLYENPGLKKSQWQKFLRACPAWQSRHELLRECFEPDFAERQEKYKGAKCLQDFDYKRTVDPHTLALVPRASPCTPGPTCRDSAAPRTGGRRCRVPRKS